MTKLTVTTAATVYTVPNDKVSIVKTQAKAIKEKDDYIDQLEYKIKNLK